MVLLVLASSRLKSLYECLPTFMNQYFLSADLLPKFTFRKILAHCGVYPNSFWRRQIQKGCKYWVNWFLKLECMHQINIFISALLVMLNNVGYCAQNVNGTLWGLFLLLQLYSTVALPYFCTYFFIDVKIILILVTNRHFTAKSPGWSKDQNLLCSCCKTVCCRRKKPHCKSNIPHQQDMSFSFHFYFLSLSLSKATQTIPG